MTFTWRFVPAIPIPSTPAATFCIWQAGTRKPLPLTAKCSTSNRTSAITTSTSSWQLSTPIRRNPTWPTRPSNNLLIALPSYREAVLQLGHAKQSEAAETFLRPFAALSILLGEGSSALAFVQQQKLDDEEQQTVAFLQTMAGNPSAAQQSLQRFASSHPWIAPRALEIDQALADITAAVSRGDGQTPLSRAATIPDFQLTSLLFLKARAHLLTNDYASAETGFRACLRQERVLANPGLLAGRFPVLGILSHYYLGQLYERTGKHDQSINEYQEFLSHFASAQSRLPQVAEARTALKRLMQ